MLLIHLLLMLLLVHLIVTKANGGGGPRSGSGGGAVAIKPPMTQRVLPDFSTFILFLFSCLLDFVLSLLCLFLRFTVITLISLKAIGRYLEKEGLLPLVVLIYVYTRGSPRAYSAAAVNWQFSFQDPVSYYMEDSICFYYKIMVGATAVAILVALLLAHCLSLYQSLEVKAWYCTLKTYFNVLSAKQRVLHRTFTRSAVLEATWTLFPVFALVALAFPSFSLLYSLNVEPCCRYTIKAVGHQWFWSYEYSCTVRPGVIRLDSYMTADRNLRHGSFRLLEVDNRLTLPCRETVRLLVTSSDVLHSWAVPSLGIKIDACPGRLTRAYFALQRQGTFYGQCSEICGVNHAFMPIVVTTPSGLFHDALTVFDVKIWKFFR